jgi:hypothetical protein
MNASSLEQNVSSLLPEHKEKQHYSTRWMALLKSVEWMGFIEIGRKCKYQSKKQKQHYSTRWMALLKSVEWLGLY